MFIYHGRQCFNPEFVISSNLNFQVPATDERDDQMKEAREETQATLDIVNECILRKKGLTLFCFCSNF
jgi:hypothetical protein